MTSKVTMRKTCIHNLSFFEKEEKEKIHNKYVLSY